MAVILRVGVMTCASVTIMCDYRCMPDFGLLVYTYYPIHSSVPNILEVTLQEEERSWLLGRHDILTLEIHVVPAERLLRAL